MDSAASNTLYPRWKSGMLSGDGALTPTGKQEPNQKGAKAASKAPTTTGIAAPAETAAHKRPNTESDTAPLKMARESDEHYMYN